MADAVSDVRLLHSLNLDCTQDIARWGLARGGHFKSKRERPMDGLGLYLCISPQRITATGTCWLIQQSMNQIMVMPCLWAGVCRG